MGFDGDENGDFTRKNRDLMGCNLGQSTRWIQTNPNCCLLVSMGLSNRSPAKNLVHFLQGPSG